MTKGDRDKLRVEIAGRFVAALIVAEAAYHPAWETGEERRERHMGEAVTRSNALLDRLGLSEEAETAAIRKMADELRGAP